MRIREIAWLPQGHPVQPQLDSSSDDLVGDAIIRSAGTVGEGVETSLELSVEVGGWLLQGVSGL